MSIDENWDRRISRRTFLGVGGLSTVAFALSSTGALAQSQDGRAAGFDRLGASLLA